MSWLLFLDESGHDHKQMPYEVRGGVALQDSQLWPFAQAMQRLELESFGTQLHLFGKEIKGCKLLDKDRFKWANQSPMMESASRQKHCRGFLTKGLERKARSRPEFTAFGQACLEMARGTFQLLLAHQAVLFASVVPRNFPKAAGPKEDYLRKDHVFFVRAVLLLSGSQASAWALGDG